MLKSDCEWYVRLAQQVLDDAASEPLGPRPLFGTRPPEQEEAELACVVMQLSKDLGIALRELTEWLRANEEHRKAIAPRARGKQRTAKY